MKEVKRVPVFLKHNVKMTSFWELMDVYNCKPLVGRSLLNYSYDEDCSLRYVSRGYASNLAFSRRPVYGTTR